MQFIYSIFFCSVFLVIANWFQLISFVAAFSKPEKNIKAVQDKWITSLVKSKTNILLKSLMIFESDKPFGMMAGTYPWPKMILSSKLYKTFTKGELEWVVLHEIAHYKFWHTLKMAATQFLLLGLGIITVNLLPISLESFLLIGPLGLVMSIVSIRLMRIFEYEADYFAIQNVEDPKSVISAQEKMKKGYNTGGYKLLKEGSILREMLLWNINPSERVKLARERLSI